MQRASKKFTWMLFLLVSAVWGTIALNIVASMSVADDSALSVKEQSYIPNRISLQKYTYISDIRDPFQFIAPHPKDTLKKMVSPKPIWTPPPFKLTGILSAGKHHTAMIEGPGGAVWFLQEKDTLSGMKILKINEQAVTYFYQKKKNDWILEKP